MSARIVLATIDAEVNAEIWTLAEHFPAAMRAEEEKMPSMRRLEALLPGAEVEAGQARLRADLESGDWDERHGHLRTLPELDIGLRIVSLEL